MGIDLGVIKFGFEAVVMFLGWLISLAVVSYRAGKKTSADREAFKKELSEDVGDLKGVIEKSIEKLRLEHKAQLEVSVAGLDRRLSVVEDKQNNRAAQFASLKTKLENMPDHSDFNKLIQSEAKNAATLDQLNHTVNLIRESLVREREGQNKFINEQAAGKTKS